MQITRNVTWQGDGEEVVDLVPDAGEPPRYVFHHIVNLYQPAGHSGLGADQTATIESMRRAREVHHLLGGTASIVQIATHDEGDTPHMPTDFRSGHLLERTIQDLQGFEDGPPFPLLFDILAPSRGREQPPPTHIVFTNADICLQPYFYPFVQGVLSSGFDSLIVNRRTVSEEFIGQPLSLASAEFGRQHPGLDCFVFPASLLESFTTNTACVGIGFVMRGLMHNLVAHAERLLVLTDAHLTFHFGDDRPWNSPEFATHTEHNRRQDSATYERLAADPLHRERLHAFFEAKPKYRPPGAATR